MMDPESAEETLAAHPDTGLSSAESNARRPGLSSGDLVGRYVVLSVLGAGGMGVVYGAYDPELDRKVALKLLRRRTPSRGRGGRLLREAQALAKLSHPGVVAVHDVGMLGEALWIAMEYVAGQTLREWLKQRPRTWREIIAVFEPLARGVVAAHEAGLVHGDVKPDNVMCGDDGRVRVMDFGLSRVSALDSEGSDVGTDRSQRRDFGAEVTDGRGFAGTPAYMAPEQIAGQPADERSDQFSLCVTLWEALYSERPFEGASMVNVAANVLDGNIRAPTQSAGVPHWLRRIVRRGLRVAPEDRWPSIVAMLAALQRGRVGARARAAGVGIVGVGVVVGAMVGASYLDTQRSIDACAEQGAEVEAVWNEDARSAVREGLLASGAGHATVTAEKVMPWLDAQADALRRARIDVCLDHRVERTWDADMVSRSRWCLDELQMELSALVVALSNADFVAVTGAIAAAATLGRVEVCRDATLLARLPAPPTEERDQVRDGMAKLARASALGATGKYEEGLAVARGALGQAEALGWPSLTAAAGRRVGVLLSETGAFAAAETTLESAYFEAARAGATEEALTAAELLVVVVGERRARHDDGLRWSRQAGVLRLSLPDPAGLRHARSLISRALVHSARGEFDETATLCEQALRIQEAAFGDEHLSLASTLNNLANAYAQGGAFDRAAALYERTLSIQSDALGAEHPELAMTLSNFANIRLEKGQLEEAAKLYSRALVIREQALGPEHPDVAMTLNNLGRLQLARGAYDEAEELDTRALGIFERALGAEHPLVARGLDSLAELHAAQGAYAEAAQVNARALAIRERTLGPEHVFVGISLNSLANVHYATGAYEEAAQLYARALAIGEKAMGPKHPDVAMTMNNLANVHLATGAYDEATQLYERALAIQKEALGPEHINVAMSLAGLASVRAARGEYEEAGRLHAEVLAMQERALGPDHPSVGQSLANLAGAHASRGAYEEATVLYERSLAILERSLGREHPLIAHPLVGLAGAALAHGRAAQAVPLAERALSLREAGSAPAAEIAEARLLLAKALAATGG